MHPHLRSAGLLFTLFLWSTALRAESFIMEPLSDDDSLEPFIIGGAPADPRKWPETFVFNFPGGKCTSIIVGLRAVLTAAHSLSGNMTGSIVLNGQPIALTCTLNPKYVAPKPVADIALCHSTGRGDLKAPDLKYEVLNTDANAISNNDQIILLGYGCRDKDGEGGVLAVGSASITATPSSGLVYETTGGAAGCKGDSGRAGYRIIDANKRSVFAVLSSGDQQKVTTLASVTYKDNIDFLRDWRSSSGAKICDLDQGVPNCRY